MASKRDLVEANTFNRRRLVTAFVSGAPGGREVDPQSPAKAIVAGVVLAAFVVGGAALAGVLKPTLPHDWESNTLVVGKDSGSRYFSYEGTLYPVVNTTTARLLVEPSDYDVVFAPESELATKERGPTLGILGAPDALPPAENLVQTGWTSCLDQRGRTRMTVGSSSGAHQPSDASAIIARAGGQVSVVVNGHRHRIDGDPDDTLTALGLDDQRGFTTPGRWLDLFPAGPDLGPVDVPEAGQPVPARWDVPSGVSQLGTVLELPASDGGSRWYLLRRTGRVPLSETGVAMYQVSNGAFAEPVRVGPGDLAGIPLDSDGQPYPQGWPKDQPTPLEEPAVCAQLDSGTPGQDPAQVRLAVPQTTFAGTGGSAEVLPQGDGDEVKVEPGGGALVRSVSGAGAHGTVVLVTSTGERFPLSPVAEEEVRSRLGYEQIQPATVPPAWVEPMVAGPELSMQAANDPVRRPTGGGS